MKKCSISKVKNQNWPSKYFVLFLLLCLGIPIVGITQKSTQLFEKEIEVSSEVVIKTNGPQSPRISGNGTLHTRQVDENYVVSGRKSEVYIYVLDKRFEVFTWDQDRIKQVTKVTVECETESQVKALFQDLHINLKENAAGQVHVECEMNIDKFMLENGWFKADNNTVVLDNGEVYQIKYLELSTTLYVPKKSNFQIESEEVNLSLADHEGQLEINMTHGSFAAKEINEIKGKFKSVKVEIDKVSKGDLQCKDSNIQINQADELILDSSISTLGFKKVGKLLINKSVNDKLTCGLADLVYMEQALYSELDIKNVEAVVEMDLKNCDLTIASIKGTVSKILIKNQNATVKLGVQNLNSYLLISKQVNQANYQLPGALTKIEATDSELTYTHGVKPYKTEIEIDCSLCSVVLSDGSF